MMELSRTPSAAQAFRLIFRQDVGSLTAIGEGIIGETLNPAIQVEFEVPLNPYVMSIGMCWIEQEVPGIWGDSGRHCNDRRLTPEQPVVAAGSRDIDIGIPALAQVSPFNRLAFKGVRMIMDFDLRPSGSTVFSNRCTTISRIAPGTLSAR